MAKGIKKAIYKTLLNVNAEIKGNAERGLYAGALSAEGYAGGYRDALHDILLLLNGTIPNRRNYWDMKQ